MLKGLELLTDHSWVVDEPVVIRLADYEGCSITLTTSAHRILAFQHGTMGQLIGIIAIIMQ